MAISTQQRTMSSGRSLVIAAILAMLMITSAGSLAVANSDGSSEGLPRQTVRSAGFTSPIHFDLFRCWFAYRGCPKPRGGLA